MKKLIALVLFVASALVADAQNITKVTTLIIKNDILGQTNAIHHGNGTNWVSLLAGEAARVSSQQHVTLGEPETNFAEWWYIKDGWYWTAYEGDVVEGPVHFVIELTADSKSAARMTLERWKVAKR